MEGRSAKVCPNALRQAYRHTLMGRTCSWKYTRSVVLDGNFSAQHRKMRNPDDDVALVDGHAFMVTDAPYKEHLKTVAEFHEVSC